MGKCAHVSDLHPALQNPGNNYSERNSVHPPQQLCGTHELAQFLSHSPATKQLSEEVSSTDFPISECVEVFQGTASVEEVLRTYPFGVSS